MRIRRCDTIFLRSLCRDSKHQLILKDIGSKYCTLKHQLPEAHKLRGKRTSMLEQSPHDLEEHDAVIGEMLCGFCCCCHQTCAFGWFNMSIGYVIRFENLKQFRETKGNQRLKGVKCSSDHVER